MATKVSKLKRQNLKMSLATTGKVGRPAWWEQDKAKLVKLEHAFSTGCTDAEACSYGDISLEQLYYYQEKNPYFTIRKQQLKEKLVLKARETVVKGLDNMENARWYLERKSRDEFGRLQFPEAPSGAIDEIAKLAKTFNELIENVKRKNNNSSGRDGDLPKAIEPISVRRQTGKRDSD